MSIYKSLIGGFAKPFNCFCEIFFYSIAVEVAKPKFKLRVHIFLLGGF